MYGGASNTRKRAVGSITDVHAFLAWALRANHPIVQFIEVPKTPLNNLAKSLLESGAGKDSVPGFVFDYDESLTIR
jgi:hypothetical protein